MQQTFRAWDPSSITSKSYSTACEACYSRKVEILRQSDGFLESGANETATQVKCELVDDGAKCKQCLDHGVECKSRTRKRKAQSLDEGQRGEEGSNGVSSPSASRRKVESPDASTGAPRRRMSTMSSGKPYRAAHRSSNVPVPDLFVNRDAGTSFSPESTENIETPVQDRFRNASYLSRSAILGEDFQDIDHAHPERIVSDDKISSTELKVLKLYGAFELPELPLRQSLIEAFVERCSTWMPVFDVTTFTGTSPTGEGSLLLSQAVILVGSLMRPDVCGKGFSERQYQRVKALIHSGYERNPLNILAALCLVQWYTPTAPKDISTDTPRFWNTYAIGLAQQMGLHRPPSKDSRCSGLRKRIWWTLVARDNITASAHGRPRVIQPEDTTTPLPSVQDFAHPPELAPELFMPDIRTAIFVQYVAITRILGDLCQVVTRKGEVSPEDRRKIGSRLQDFLEALPDPLRLYSSNGAQQYSLELAQLHVPVLIAITILFRPRTIYQLAADNAGSTTAAFLSFRVFQAIELREQTRFLASSFAWHLLVTAIPLLSCTKVTALRTEANEALSAIEGVLETLGKVRPSAATNLRSVRAIRKAMSSKAQIGGPASASGHPERDDAGSIQLGRQILQAYGPDAIRQYEQIALVLGAHCNTQADRSVQAAAHTLSCLSGRQDAVGMDNGRLTPETEPYIPPAGMDDEIQNAFTALFEDDTLSTSWMMRDWMDELQF